MYNPFAAGAGDSDGEDKASPSKPRKRLPPACMGRALAPPDADGSESDESKAEPVPVSGTTHAPEVDDYMTMPIPTELTTEREAEDRRVKSLLTRKRKAAPESSEGGSLGDRMNASRELGLDKPIASDNIGFRLLAKSGYKAGMTIGKPIDAAPATAAAASASASAGGGGVGGANRLSTPLAPVIRAGRIGLGRDTQIEKQLAAKANRIQQHKATVQNRFVQHTKTKVTARQTEYAIYKVKLVCQQLDISAGIIDNPMWYVPPEPNPDEPEPATDAKSKPATSTAAAAASTRHAATPSAAAADDIDGLPVDEAPAAAAAVAAASTTVRRATAATATAIATATATATNSSGSATSADADVVSDPTLRARLQRLREQQQTKSAAATTAGPATAAVKHILVPLPHRSGSTSLAPGAGGGRSAASTALVPTASAAGASGAAGAVVVAPKTLPELTAELNSLLCYVRDAYRYCHWCGIRFNDAADMSANCPGVYEADHDADTTTDFDD